jgi:hypothetical protein
VRQKPNFLKWFNAILAVQSRREKFSAFAVGQITFINSPRPASLEGRLAIVTDARRDAVDGSGAPDEGVLLADGEVVWS